MRVVSTHLDSRYTGLLGCLSVLLKENFFLWQHNVKPVYDMFGMIKPDIMIMMVDQVDKSILNALKDHECKLILFGSGVPQSLIDIDKPSLLCAPASIPTGIRKNIESDSYKVEYLSDYANIAQIFNGKFDPTIDADVTYISHFPVNQRGYIIECLSVLKSKGINLKIVGQERIPLPEYLGTASVVEIPHILASSKVTIDFDGQILLDAAANKTFTISNVPNGLFPSFHNDVTKLCNGIIGFLRKESWRKRKIKEAYEAVTENDTSFHRIIQIFSAINENEVVELASNKLEELI